MTQADTPRPAVDEREAVALQVRLAMQDEFLCGDVGRVNHRVTRADKAADAILALLSRPAPETRGVEVDLLRRVEALERDSHPPIDLEPMVLEILEEQGLISASPSPEGSLSALPPTTPPAIRADTEVVE